MAPSLCGSFLTDRRSLLAFTWTLTCVSTLVAFIVTTAYIVHVHTSYKRMEKAYNDEMEYQQQQGENEHSGDNQREWEQFFALTSMQSGSLTFVALYTMILAVGLSFYGSTAIVGFTSLRGVYIAPCFSTSSGAVSTLKLGMFGGAIVLFANLLLICAVIFGEVEDWNEYRQDEHEREQDNQQPYEVEQIATVLAVTCMFLASLYSIFAILLFLFFGSQETDDEIILTSSKQLSSISNDPRRENFITMEGDLS